MCLIENAETAVVTPVPCLVCAEPPPLRRLAPSPVRGGAGTGGGAGLAAGLLGAVALMLAVLPAPARAERADRDQPLSFSADRMRLDEKRRVRVLSGDVEIAKGSLLIRAAQIEIRELAQGQVATASGASGKPATFRQKREGVDETVEGQALRVEYDTRTETVRFTQQATVRRFRGTVLADEVSGQSIVYDATTEVIDVVGADGSASAAGGTPTRVRGVLAPSPGAASR